MVSVVHSVAAQSDSDQFFTTLAEGLGADEVASLKGAVEYALEVYGEALLGSGERIRSRQRLRVIRWTQGLNFAGSRRRGRF